MQWYIRPKVLCNIKEGPQVLIHFLIEQVACLFLSLFSTVVCGGFGNQILVFIKLDSFIRITRKCGNTINGNTRLITKTSPQATRRTQHVAHHCVTNMFLNQVLLTPKSLPSWEGTLEAFLVLSPIKLVKLPGGMCAMFGSVLGDTIASEKEVETKQAAQYYPGVDKNKINRGRHLRYDSIPKTCCLTWQLLQHAAILCFDVVRRTLCGLQSNA